jgi:hypothetical protein
MAKGKKKESKMNESITNKCQSPTFPVSFKLTEIVRKKTMDLSVYMFMSKPFMKAVLDAYFTKKELPLAVPNIMMW